MSKTGTLGWLLAVWLVVGCAEASIATGGDVWANTESQSAGVTDGTGDFPTGTADGDTGSTSGADTGTADTGSATSDTGIGDTGSADTGAPPCTATSCTGTVPVCDPISHRCVCGPYSCLSGAFCDAVTGHCVPCGSGAAFQAHCGTVCSNCDVAGGVCNASGQCGCDTPADCGGGTFCGADGKCQACDQDDRCGPACGPCAGTPATPHCNNGTCAECGGDAHCTYPAMCNKSLGQCVACAGALLSGACWYTADQNQSCAAICASHGGYDEATKTYAGSEGSTAGCRAVLDAVHQAPGSAVLDNFSFVSGVGCALVSGVPAWEGDKPTTADAVDFAARRICACIN